MILKLYIKTYQGTTVEYILDHFKNMFSKCETLAVSYNHVESQNISPNNYLYLQNIL